MTIQSASSFLTAVLIDDCDLATAGLRALLTPYGDRVRLVEPRTALARPEDLDVILYEPMGLSPMGASMLRDLQRLSDARTAVFSWAGAGELPTPVLTAHLPKRLTAAQLVRAVEDLAVGRWTETASTSTSTVISTHISTPQRATGTTTATPAARSAAVTLTPRESDVIALVTAGRSNLEICEELSISVNSVKTYIRSAYRKMGVTRRSQAVLWGITHGFDQVVPGQARHAASAPSAARFAPAAATAGSSVAAASATAPIAMAILPS